MKEMKAIGNLELERYWLGGVRGFSMKLGLGFGVLPLSELSDRRSLTVSSRTEEEEEEEEDDGGFPGSASFVRVL